MAGRSLAVVIDSAFFCRGGCRASDACHAVNVQHDARQAGD